MATLVLTAVGTALGGPVGGALGALLGQAVDSRFLFAPKGVEGARLSDLRLQTSRYGDGIARLYGTMRVAGTVIWATDLKERRHKQSAGKGQPTVTTYSYSASFAVALSSRPVVRVGRIWADGNLLRGTAGDFKTALGAFRLHDGSEDQAPDPLIAADRGRVWTPAHRGVAYAVFEDLQLADYGNRIPSLSFELIADEAAPDLAAIAGDLTGGLIGGTGEAMPAFAGYAVGSGSIADALAPAVEGLGLALQPLPEEGFALVLPMVASVLADAAIDAQCQVAATNGEALLPRSESRQRADAVPIRLVARYYDPSRDYQAGAQTAERPGVGRTEKAVDWPAALDAAQARSLAGERLRGLWAARNGLDLRCDWRALTLAPGMSLSVEGQAGLWRIERQEWTGMAVRLSLVRQAGVGGVSVEASAGSAVAQADAVHGPTTLVLAELPPVDDQPASAPLLVCAAAGEQSGWRSAELFLEDGTTGTLTSLGNTAAPALLGQVTVPPLALAGAALFDERSAVTVRLLRDDMTLASVGDEALLAGANHALLGREVLQFGRATRVDERVWRLSHLLRGRRGTEWAMAGHGAGERFLLLDSETLVDLPSSAAVVGTTARVAAIGIGDTAPEEVDELVLGQAVLPLAPVHLMAERAGGDWRISWVRRSRAGWRWADAVDAPLGEEQERYAVALRFGGQTFRSAETGVSEWTYDAATIAVDRMAGVDGGIEIVVRQVGTYGAGREGLLALTI